MLRDKKLYLVTKILEQLPGKQEEIARDLKTLLEDINGKVANERESHLQQIRDFLTDCDLKEITREAISRRIAIFNSPVLIRLPTDIVNHVLSFFTPAELNKVRELSQNFKKAADAPAYWQKELIYEYGITEELAKALTKPDVVYKRSKMLNSSHIKTLIGKLGKEVVFHGLDEKNEQEIRLFYEQKIIQLDNKERLLSLGNVQLAQFLFQKKALKRNIILYAADSGS